MQAQLQSTLKCATFEGKRHAFARESGIGM
jgi:hypothetical protein